LGRLAKYCFVQELNLDLNIIMVSLASLTV